MILGIDVSVWQDDNSTPQKMDFKKAKQNGAKFVFIKVSERMAVDLDYLDNWNNAKAAGLPRGGYHFLRWDISGLYQARAFCELLKNDPGELPPVADFEAPPKDGKYPSNALLWQFLEEVENILKIRPMIYTSPGFWNSYGKDKNTGHFDAKWAIFDLWVAHYGVSAPLVPKPWYSWKFWQFTSSGDGLAFGAESKSIDLNYFNGDEAAFSAYIGSESTGNEAVEPPDENAELEARVDALEKWARDINFKG